MKYQYKFGTGYESIEVDEEWAAVLKEFDRQERNSNIKVEKTVVHYDAFDYEPDFLGKEDKDIADSFDGTPAFAYAVSFLLPRHREVLFRRAVQGETFASIGKSFGQDASVAHGYYKRLCLRFRKRYDEWRWLHSNENQAPPGVGKVEIITAGLTPAQIMAIRAYRCQYRSLREIADLVGVSYYHVQECLHDNPILETRCPACGAPIEQNAFNRMVVFCSRKCYFSWFRRNSQTDRDEVSTTRGKIYLTEPQKMAIDFYRQVHIPIPMIGKIIGVSRQHVAAHAYSHPIPYTLCEFCGAKIPPQHGGKLLKYCSAKCRERRDNRAKTLYKRNRGHVKQRVLPTAEQLLYAIELREECFSYKQIQQLAGMSRKDTQELFRFHQTVERLCANCKKPFVTEDLQELYCSDKCQAKAKAKRRKKRKEEKKNAVPQCLN